MLLNIIDALRTYAFYDIIASSMSANTIPRRLLLQQLSAPLRRRVQPGQAQCVARRWYAEEKGDRESFKGQLYQSTHERVQRERADQERFARHREAEKASSGSSALAASIGKLYGLLCGAQWH